MKYYAYKRVAPESPKPLANQRNTSNASQTLQRLSSQLNHYSFKTAPIIKRFSNHETCLDHLELEKVRWGDTPTCPHCGSDHVARKVDGDRVGRWNCHSCKSSFNVLSGTIFQSTQVPLQKWFLAIMLMLTAKKSLSGHQLARDVGIGAKAGWRLAMKIRTGMRGGDNR